MKIIEFDLVKDLEKITDLKKNRYYSEVKFNNTAFLSKKSCKHCHGTGYVGWTLDPKTKERGNQIQCNCLIKLTKKEEETKNE